MYARITQFEIDPLRIGLDEALDRFKDLILPEVRKQPGYLGVFVLRTPEGKGVLMSLWETEAAAQAGVDTGYYSEQVEKFVMFTKQPPGRGHYQVVFQEEPRVAASLN